MITWISHGGCDLGGGQLQLLVLGDTATSLIGTEGVSIYVIAEEGNQSINAVARALVLIAGRLLVLGHCLLLSRLRALWDHIGSLGRLGLAIGFHLWRLGGRLEWSLQLQMRLDPDVIRQIPATHLFHFWLARARIGTGCRRFHHVT